MRKGQGRKVVFKCFSSQKLPRAFLNKSSCISWLQQTLLLEFRIESYNSIVIFWSPFDLTSLSQNFKHLRLLCHVKWESVEFGMAGGICCEHPRSFHIGATILALAHIPFSSVTYSSWKHRVRKPDKNQKKRFYRANENAPLMHVSNQAGVGRGAWITSIHYFSYIVVTWRLHPVLTTSCCQTA